MPPSPLKLKDTMFVFMWKLSPDLNGLNILANMRYVSKELKIAAEEVRADVGFWAQFVSNKDSFLKKIPALAFVSRCKYSEFDAFLSRGEYSDLLEGMCMYMLCKNVPEKAMDALQTLAVRGGRPVMQQMIRDGALATCVAAFHAPLSRPSLKLKFCTLVHYLICIEIGMIEEQVEVVELARKGGVLEIAEQGSQPGSLYGRGTRTCCQQIMEAVTRVDEHLKECAELYRRLAWHGDKCAELARDYNKEAETYNTTHPTRPPMLIMDLGCYANVKWPKTRVLGDLYINLEFDTTLHAHSCEGGASRQRDFRGELPVGDNIVGVSYGGSMHGPASNTFRIFEYRNRKTMYIEAIEQKKKSHQQIAYKTAMMVRAFYNLPTEEKFEWEKKNPIRTRGVACRTLDHTGV